jgi:hypothetical protein
MAENEATLADLVEGQLTVVLRGKTYPVAPIDGFGYQLLAQMDEATSLATLYRIAAKCLKGSMTKDEVIGTEDVNGLSAAEVGYVIRTARSQVTQVEATLPNDGGPAESPKTEPVDSASQESPPAIQLAS